MASVQIPNLPAVTSIAGAEQFEVVQAGMSMKATASQFLAYFAQAFGAGTVSSINFTDGLSGGLITTTGTVGIANTGVTAAGYGTAAAVPTLTINARGQITAASNTTISIPASAINTAIPNASLANSSVTVGTTALVLGTTTAALAGLTSVTLTQNPSSALQAATKQYVDAAAAAVSITIGTTSIASGGTSLTLGGLTSVAVTQNPTTALQLATKQYVDGVASGQTVHAPVSYASTTAYTVTYANGASGVGATLTNNAALAAFSIDGATPAVSTRVLIKDQAAPAQNGVYTVTTAGSGAVAWVLTRATDYDTIGTGASRMEAGAYVLVTAGATNISSSWVQTSTVATIGTDAVSFSQYSTINSYTAGTGLTLGGSQFSVTATGVTAATYGSASTVPVVAVNAQGQITSASSTTITLAASAITSGQLAPSFGGTGISSLGAGVATWLGAPSSANLAAAVTGETGSGALVFATSPTLVTPALGVATATSIAVGGATLGTDAVAVTGNITTSTLNIGGGALGTDVFLAVGGMHGYRIWSGTTTGYVTAANTIDVQTTITNTDSSSNNIAWLVNNDMAGGRGARTSIHAIGSFTAPTTADNPSRFYTALFGEMHVSSSDFGTGTSIALSKGSIYGLGVAVYAEAGATNLAGVGSEIDCEMQAGSSASLKCNLSLIRGGSGLGTDVVQGAVHDSMLCFCTDSSANAVARLGISFGREDAAFGFDTTSTLIGSSTPGYGSFTAGYGLDFNAVSFGTAAIRTPGFLVNPSGLVTVTNAFGALAALESAGGNGFRWTLNNNNTFTLQHTANGFSTASSPITVSSSDVVTFEGAIAVGNTVNLVSPTSPNRTVTMVINGTTYYLAAKTTND